MDLNANVTSEVKKLKNEKGTSGGSLGIKFSRIATGIALTL